jgi:hypothetical protein
MKAPRIRKLSIQRLHHKLRQRIFAVPKLQREFVWNGTRAAALLDSVYHSMPIGSILVWETKPSGYDLLRQNLNILPPFDTGNHRGWFLIDGQQRLSVLHESFEGGEHENSSGQVIDFGRLCFLLRPADNGDGTESTRFAYRKPVDRHYTAVQDILATDWKRRLKGYTKPLLKKIADCRRRLLSYKVPVMVVESDELEEIREVFLRINSQGMKVNAADRAFARATTVDLRDLAHALRSGLNPEFHDLDFTMILQGFAFVTGDGDLDVGQRALEASINRWERRIEAGGRNGPFYRTWKRYRVAVGKAVDYLNQRFGVYHSGLLPSQYMVATLSVFFNQHSAAPNSQQAGEIRKWFWATGVGLRYSGRGYRQNLTADVKFFRKLARGTGARFKFPERVDRSDLVRAEYTQRSSLVNAFFCLLAQHKPCYVANGEPIPESVYASRANRKDRHHIFPRQLLATYRFPHRDYNSICNICLIVAEENQEFGMKRPGSYLATYARQKHFARAMKSHLIPYKPGSGIWVKGVRRAYRQFRRERADWLCKAFESEAGMKLFRRG